MASSSSCRLLSLESLEAAGSSSSTSSSSFHPSPPRARRHRRVLYPAYRSRRPPLREAPDQALRWLVLLSAVVFLQIYNEETCSCTDHQSQSPNSAESVPQDSEGSLGTVQGWTGDDTWRVTTMGGASETQLECVVA